MSSNVTITSLPVTVDGVTFRLAEHADKPAILDGWFSTFVPDEAMCQAMQWKDGRPQTVEEVLSDILDEGCTPVAVDAHGAVLGFFCCHICHPGEEKPTLQDLHVQFAGAHVFACLIDVCNQMYHSSDVFALHPEAQTLFDMFTLCTLPAGRGRGIAKRLSEAALVVARDRKCDLAVMFATADATRSIARHLGMSSFKEREWSSFRNADGGELFPNIRSEKATAHLLWLREPPAAAAS